MPRFTKMEFPGLYREFLDSGYLGSLDGVRHLNAYEEGREEGRLNYQSVLEAKKRGEDVTELVLLKLLPHNDTAGNRERGAWVHIAPAIRGDVKRWFEGARWTRPEDWPAIADAILDFLHWCNEDPELLSEACTEFARLPYVKGFQTGMLTPILNALRPDDYLLINYKPRQTINYFSGESYGLKITEYPSINRTGRRLIEEFAGEMDQAGAPALSDADRFDMFSHWLVAERDFHFPDKRYWKIAPGEKGWQWDECRENGFIGIGWNDVGDVSGLSRDEFYTLQEEMEAERGYKKEATNQVWAFTHDIQEGDVIVANRGTREILGIGTVVGPYEFVPDAHYAHQFPVRWDDTVPRRVEEKGWRRTLIEIKPEKYEELRAAPRLDGVGQPDIEVGGSDAETLFSVETFDLLEGLHEDPSKDYYHEHREAIRDHVEEPFRRLVRGVARRQPAPITGLMETEKGVFARILKNDWGKGGAWDYYWGAFYPKGEKRIEDAQLFTVVKRDSLEFGFSVGHYGSDQRKRFLDNCKAYREELVDLLEPVVEEGFGYGDHKDENPYSRERSLSEWLENIDGAGHHASMVIAREKVLELSERDLVEIGTRTFEQLLPFVLLATSEDPMAEIIEYIGEEARGTEPEPEYGIEQLSRDTSIGEDKLRRWVRAIERKGQAIFYGPPGTGKTFIAQRLAMHLTGGGDGFYDLVQFHPSYSYEDFVQGIRPESREGTLCYPVVPGRFKEFCREAAKRNNTCVLIVDEINRANLSRVFGELMYLLEYREEEVPLAGGGKFRIPDNVCLIGTMNTADRSIALVDHALRRRFAFLELYPDYELLRKYHSATGFPVDNLIGELMKLNRRIDDRQYEVGITFFLYEHLEENLEDIWRMEIEPYLEEYFFDRPAVVDEYRWERIGDTLIP